jgi:DNA-binding MarR family transcriptional regulator
MYQAKLPMPISQLMVLLVLMNEDRQSLTQVCQKLNRSKQQIHHVIDWLDLRQLIVKESAMKDRRYVWISITPKGQSLVEQYAMSVQHDVDELRARLSS